MTKGKKYILPIAIAVAGIYFIIRSLKKTSSIMDEKGNIDTSGSGSTSGGTTTTASDFPLTKGSKGALVKRLQLAIGVDKLPKYKDDGDFGTETLNALKLVTGKTQIDNLAQIDAIAAKRGLVWSGSSYISKLIAAPKTDPLKSYYYGQDPFNFGK